MAKPDEGQLTAEPEALGGRVDADHVDLTDRFVAVPVAVVVVVGVVAWWSWMVVVVPWHASSRPCTLVQ